MPKYATCNKTLSWVQHMVHYHRTYVYRQGKTREKSSKKKLNSKMDENTENMSPLRHNLEFARRAWTDTWTGSHMTIMTRMTRENDLKTRLILWLDSKVRRYWLFRTRTWTKSHIAIVTCMTRKNDLKWSKNEFGYSNVTQEWVFIDFWHHNLRFW